MQDLITQEVIWCFSSLSLQNIWSMRDELDLQHLVGTVIFGKRPCVTKRSKYFWNSDRSLIWSRSILKSPVMMMWQLFFDMFEITGVSSSQNCLIVLLLLFDRGGLYILPIIILSQRDSPLTSMNTCWCVWTCRQLVLQTKATIHSNNLKNQALCTKSWWARKLSPCVYPNFVHNFMMIRTVFTSSWSLF